MIEGVELKRLVTHPDERGFFREIVRNTEEIIRQGEEIRIPHDDPTMGYDWTALPPIK
jgi:dTDP-4-dehydrorhamnose 3,5-epimerase-like enzyme